MLRSVHCGCDTLEQNNISMGLLQAPCAAPEKVLIIDCKACSLTGVRSNCF